MRHDLEGGGNGDDRKPTRGWLSELGQAFVVDSAQRVAVWLTSAAVTGAGALFAALSSADRAIVALLCGLVGGMLVPPAIGLVRYGVYGKWRRYRRALGEDGRLRSKIAELGESLSVAEDENKRLTEALDLAARRELEFERDSDQQKRADDILADWIIGTLIDPYPIRADDPDRAFEDWLNDVSMNTLRVVLDHKWVALAVCRESADMYEITHRSAGVPEPVLEHDRSPAHRPLPECVRRHVPHAEAFSFHAGGARHWIMVFPERPIETPLRRSAVVTVIAIVAHVFRSTLDRG